MKICFRCKIEKKKEEFNKDRTKIDGLCSFCKACHREGRINPLNKWKVIKRECYIKDNICYIPMTNGLFAICDADKYDLVKDHQWRLDGRGYCTMQIGRHTTLLHRLITEGKEGFEIDHINHDPLDNRTCNLRLATRAQNCMNYRAEKKNSSGFKGVSWNARDRIWRPKIKLGQRQINLGSFFCLIKAIEAYNKAALELFGEFACINKIPQKEIEVEDLGY